MSPSQIAAFAQAAWKLLVDAEEETDGIDIDDAIDMTPGGANLSDVDREAVAVIMQQLADDATAA